MKFWKHTPPLVYRLWPFLPARLQSLLLYLGSPKVTMGVAAVIVDRHGRVLLAHHRYRSHHQWAFPAGLLCRDEQPPAALARELREELQVDAEIGPLLFARTHARARHHTLYYRATLRDLPHCNGIEVDEYRFVALEDLPAYTGNPVPSWLWEALGLAPLSVARAAS